jgi:hypothetical protein
MDVALVAFLPFTNPTVRHSSVSGAVLAVLPTLWSVAILTPETLAINQSVETLACIVEVPERLSEVGRVLEFIDRLHLISRVSKDSLEITREAIVEESNVLVIKTLQNVSGVALVDQSSSFQNSEVPQKVKGLPVDHTLVQSTPMSKSYSFRVQHFIIRTARQFMIKLQKRRGVEVFIDYHNLESHRV